MNLSAPFISRPVATTLVMLSFVLFGVMAYLRLPVASLPDVDFPTISVSANLPGASAETMAASVATPLEREFSGIDGVTSMSSENALGITNVTLQFDLSRELDSAAQDVQAAIARAQPRMPHEMPAPPSYRKVNPADRAVLLLSLSSENLPLSFVNEYAETRLGQTISQVPGVALVNVWGGQKFAVRVQADPQKLAAHAVGLDQMAEAIAASNVNVPTGTLYGPRKAFAIETNSSLAKAQDYAEIIVSYKNGAPLRVGELGRVLDSVENDKTAAWVASSAQLDRAVVLAVQKQPGSNTVEVTRGVLALLPAFRKEIPGGISLNVLFDLSHTVRDSVHDVQFTLLLTLGLVIGVIFLFLRRLTATLIPSVAVPLAIFATFACMYLLGFSLNNLSLMALTLSVGFVVDDAIVVLENIVRHVEMGKSPMQAAFEASAEIGFTIVSMTLSLAAVFLPFLFMGGILGSLFREFAVTMAISILISGFVSLTLTPMMAARLLKPGHQSPPGKFFRAVERALDGLSALYGKTLSVVLRRRRLTMLLSGACLAATVVLFVLVPKGFLPTEDTDQLQITTEAVQGISFEAIAERQKQATEIVRNHPDVEALMSSAGSRGSRAGTNQGTMFVHLRPRADRARSASEVGADLARRLAAVPGLRAFVQVPPAIRLGGRVSKSEFQYTLQSTDTQALYRETPKLADALSQSPVLADVTHDVLLSNPEISVEIDRDEAARLAVSVARIDEALYSAYGSRQVSTIFASNNSYAVILELDPRAAREPSALDQLHVRSDNGKLVPLRSVAELRQTVGPLSVNHAGQLPAATISFNVTPGHSLSEAVAVAESTAARVLPAGMNGRFQGAAEAFQDSLTGLGGLLLLAIFVIYLVLGILYESFIHPITILSALPFAGFGAVVSLMLFGIDLNVYAFVGVILLVGLVKKNGIMMVDFAIDARRDSSVSAVDAIHQACMVRFRPITMTTMAALLGTLPIALGIGAGAEARQPLGIAVVGGLLFSQTITLCVTPVVYVYMDSLSVWLREWRANSGWGVASRVQTAIENLPD